jgi:hypothetical protein
MAYYHNETDIIYPDSYRIGWTDHTEVRDIVEVNTVDGGTLWVENVPQLEPQQVEYRIGDWEIINPWNVAIADPELDDLKERIREFYQWLEQEAKEIEREEPEAVPCVDIVMKRMEEVFPRLTNYVRKCESTEYFDYSVTRNTGVADFGNSVIYGGSEVESFREHG